MRLRYGSFAAGTATIARVTSPDSLWRLSLFTRRQTIGVNGELSPGTATIVACVDEG